jgi:hypothetical protein
VNEQQELLDPDDLDFGEWMEALPVTPTSEGWRRPTLDERLQARAELWAKRIRSYERKRPA